MEETNDGDIEFSHPKRIARERKFARIGFGLVLGGFLLQAIGVALPLLPRFPTPAANGRININAPLSRTPVTFASEAQRGFHAVHNLNAALKAPEIVETVRSLEYNNWTSKAPSQGFSTGVYIGAAVRLNSFSVPQFSKEEVSDASKMAHVYAGTVLLSQKYHDLTDQEMNQLAGDWAMDIVRGLTKQ
ncbi:MAG TPA: hypothetical protein VEP30_05135 [Chthoniobacterales bacterium]|nr:hypothetical protein [Chthoniobacterales bacterium]